MYFFFLDKWNSIVAIKLQKGKVTLTVILVLHFWHGRSAAVSDFHIFSHYLINDKFAALHKPKRVGPTTRCKAFWCWVCAGSIYGILRFCCLGHKSLKQNQLSGWYRPAVFGCRGGLPHSGRHTCQSAIWGRRSVIWEMDYMGCFPVSAVCLDRCV